jgi:hypothetical protein
MKFFGYEPIEPVAPSLNQYFPKGDIEDEKCHGVCCEEVEDDPDEGRISTPQR